MSHRRSTPLEIQANSCFYVLTQSKRTIQVFYVALY